MAARATLLAALVAAAAARVVQFDDPTPFAEIKKALVVFAHPDDAETICGGLVATLIAQGTEVAYVVATNGDKGWSKNYNMTSAELAVIRQQEQLNAAAVLGVSNVTFLQQEDGRLEAADPIALKKNITIAIRTFQPDVVIAFSPETDYTQYKFGLMHRDHQTSGRAAVDAVYPATRDYLSFIDLFEGEHTAAHLRM